MKRTKRKTKTPSRCWRTADRRLIPISQLGDQHLVYILIRVEENITHNDTAIHTKRGLPDDLIALYPELVIEGIRRGLFHWVLERKYLNAAVTKIHGMAEDKAKYPMRTLRSGLVIDPKRHPNLTALDKRLREARNLV